MEARIRRNIIILLVLTFLLLVGMSAGWFFVLVRPQKEDIEKTTKRYEDFKTVAATLPENLKRRQKAEDRLEYVQEQVKFFQNRYRTFDFGDLNDPVKGKTERNRTWLRLMKEYNAAYGSTLKAQLIAAADVPPRVLLNIPAGIKVEKPPAIPEEVKPPANGFMKPSASLDVSIRGSFPDILAFFERINEVPAPGRRTILLLVSNVKLAGVSPDITANFSVTPYMIGKGKAVDFKGAIPPAPPAPPPPAPGGGGGGAPAVEPDEAPKGKKAKDDVGAE